MIESPDELEQGVPPRTLGVSLSALVVPVLATLLAPPRLAGLAAILWLLALAPIFPLAVRSGWRGVANSAATTCAVFFLTLVTALLLGRGVSPLLAGVLLVYLGVAVGVGRMAFLLHRQRADVQDLALTDNLTRLPNRRHARSFLENEFAAARRGNPLSVVLFDLDGFKAFNDVHGHRAGDRALERFGEILSSTTRRMNLSSRFGGEEFLSVLSGSEEQGAVIFAERVRNSLESVRLPQGSLTVSAGVAEFHRSMRSPDELIAAADLALYRAKRDGRNCVRVFGLPEKDSQEYASLSSSDEPEQEEDLATPGETESYPRDDESIGRSPPPVELLSDRLARFGKMVTGRSRTRTPDLEQSSEDELAEAAYSIVQAIEGRRSYDIGSGARVAAFADAIARVVGVVPNQLASETLRIACELRDVGEVAVSENLLAKRGHLTHEEVLEVRKHTLIGHRILEALVSNESVLAVVRWHHECWDGSGYPDGLSGDEIPTVARIVAIADALEAMTSPRSYRAALPWQVAVEQISGLGGSQFDPVMINGFRTVLPEIEALAEAFRMVAE